MEEEKKQKEGGNITKEKSKDSDVITISKASFWRIISGILALLLVISVYTGGFNTGSPAIKETQGAEGDQAVQPKGQQAPNQPTLDTASLTDDDAVKGDANAPVTIIEWSDFECPFCERFYTQTLPSIQKEYIDTGRVKFVYRDFPLDFHQNAQKAAEAAECADEQGKFWEMHDLLFENGVSGGVSAFKKYASDLGLDTGKFNDCLDSGKMASEIAKDLQDGARAGIRGTPGFIINGQLVSGAQPFENFKQIIDAELAK